ncbi:MAG TPA: hypothetical protein VF245_00175 [Solirubrobacterales bacterium]
MSRPSRALGTLATWIGALLIAALLVGGCGSGGDTTTAVGTDRPSDRAESGGASRAEAEGSGSAAGANTQSGAPHRSSGNENGAADRPSASPVQGKAKPAVAGDRAAVRSCLARFGRTVCNEMVRQGAAPATRVDEPSDCLKAMSKAMCEELAAAQQAGEEHGDSVNLEECIENPTPKCEAVLRPLLEAQRGH